MARPQLSRNLTTDLLGLGGLLLLNLILFSDVLFQPSRVLSQEQGDLFLHFLSWRSFGFSELQAGHLVLWNPHYLCGNPFFGNFESALLYPPNVLHLFLPMAYALNWIIALHVVLSGAFTYAWARFRGLSPIAGFLAGTVFMWGGALYLHLSAGHLPNLCAMTWIPLVFLSLEGILEKGTPVWAFLLALAFSFQVLAGHPQYVFFTLLIGTLFFALRILKADHRLRKTLLAFVSLLFAGGLTAIQLFTGYAAEGEGLRHLSIDYKMASSFSLPIENVFTLVFPEIFGKLEPGSYWGRWYPWEVSLFVGMTAFVFALMGWIQVKNPRVRMDLALAFFAFLLALGPGTPLYPLLYRWFPHANEIRGWAKMDIFLGLFLSMTAGAGFDLFLRENDVRKKWIRPLAFVSLALLSVGLMVFLCAQFFQGFWDGLFFRINWLKKTMEGLDPVVRETFSKDSGIHLAVNLLVGSLVLGLLGLLFLLENKWRNWGILLLCVGELFIFARMNRPTFPISDWQNKIAALKEFYSSHPGEDRVYGTSSDSLVAGGRDIWEYEPLVLRRYGQFVASSQGLEDNRLYSVMPVFSRLTPIFGLVRLRYILEENPKGLQFQELPFPRLPRFKLFSQWRVLPDPETARRALFAPRFDFFRKLILEKAPPFSPAPSEKSGELAWNEIDSEHIEIKAEISNPCVLLATDNFSEGWRARALGDSAQKSYEVLPGDYFLQAIPLAAGKHHILLEYVPASFSLGLRVTLLSIFLYLVLTGWAWRRHLISRTRIS